MFGFIREQMKTRCSSLRLGKKPMCSCFLMLASCVLLLKYIQYINYISEVLPAKVPRYNISCSAIYDMDPVELAKSVTIRQKHVVDDNVENLINLTLNCPLFLKSRGYEDICASEEERNFPLAYSMVVHKYPWMVERLIRATYSPSNIYCVHYDQKSSAQFMAAMEGLARCLPNVFIASKREDVIYAGFTRLKADLNCLSDLLQSEVKWKYVINLCGQDFPLRANIELVSELKGLNGANMLETTRPSAYKKDRYAFHYEVRGGYDAYKNTPVKTWKKKNPPSHGIEMFSGSAYFVLSRDFVVFMNASVVVRDFLAWCEDTYSPDEHFWATVVRLPGAPGEVPRSHPDITDLMSKTRLVKWSSVEGSLYPHCTGVHVRGICVYGAAEINWLLNYGHWFANKFDTKVDPVAVQCLEEKLEERKNNLQSVDLSCFTG